MFSLCLGSGSWSKGRLWGGGHHEPWAPNFFPLGCRWWWDARGSLVTAPSIGHLCHLPPSSTSHTRGTFGRQSRHLGRVAPDPLTTPQQGTDRGHHLSWGKQKTKNKKKLISGNKIIRGWKKPLAHRGCANMREKLLSWQNMNFFFWRRVFLPGML